MYIYIYIYILCEPVHNMHENVRLRVERNMHSWSCPVKRLRSSGAERARAPMSSAPAEPSGLELGHVGRCNVFEQPGQAMSSALAEPSEFERVRAAISSAPVELSGIEQPCRALQRRRSSSHFKPIAALGQARAAISRASMLAR